MKPISSEQNALSDNARVMRALPQGRAGDWTSFGVIALFCLGAYVALEWISFLHEYKGLPITPWNPGLGLIFALMILVGPAGGFVLFAGVVIAEIFMLQSKLEWPLVIVVAIIISLSYAFAAALARQRLRLDAGLVHLRDVLVLLAVGLAGAVIGTVLLTAIFVSFHQLEARDIVQAVTPLLVGDIIGIAVMTPLVLRLVFRRREITLANLLSFAPEALLYILFIGAALWAIIGSEGLYGPRLFYLLFVPVVVAAVRHGLDGACLSLAVTQFGLIGLLDLSGYDARVFTEFQMLMLVLTATGLVVGVVVSERQNSDRIASAAEKRLKEKETEASQAARFNLVSGMASALAHEINQPMTAARALARSAQHILRTKDGDMTRADGNLTTMIAQIDHASGVVKRMRDFLRRGRPQISTIDMRGTLEEALMLVRAQASTHRVRIQLDVQSNLPPVHADHIQLEQVVLNLVRNAIEAITGSGRQDGEIRITARRLDDPPRIEIGVWDNGPGIADDIAARLFDPLTTSKEEGLGLGLAICTTIIESHGGRIWLHSRTTGATEFRFSLPFDQSQAT